MKNLLILLFTVLMATANLNAQKSKLQNQGTAIQLHIDNVPTLVLGGELGNSSASPVQDIEMIFPKLERLGLNTVLCPASWELIDPIEGEFVFTLTAKVIVQAIGNNLKVIFFWFVAWQNSMSCDSPTCF